MEQAYKEYKATCSFSYQKRGFVLSSIFIAIFAFVLTVWWTSPTNWSVFLVLFISMTVIVVAGSIILKFVTTIRIDMYQDRIIIGRYDGSERRTTWAAVVGYDKIMSIRKITEQEINVLLKTADLPWDLKYQIKITPFFNFFSAIKETDLLFRFVCDYSNVVEIVASELSIIPSTGIMRAASQGKGIRLFVSVNNPDDFVSEINGKKENND